MTVHTNNNKCRTITNAMFTAPRPLPFARGGSGGGGLLVSSADANADADDNDTGAFVVNISAASPAVSSE